MFTLNRKWACSPMVGRAVHLNATHQGSNTREHTFSWIYSGIFRCYALSDEVLVVTSRISR